MTSLDFAKVVYRLGIDVADTTADPDDKPDVIWLDGGRVIITPKQFEKKVPEPPMDVSPDPFTLLGFAYEADIDSDGYLSHGGEQQITVIDLTSPKVNPRFDDPNASTHTVSFTGLTATIPGVGPVAIAMQPRDVRITKDGPDGSGINDLTLVSPVVPGAATPIYQGPQGVSVETLEVSTEGSLVATLSNGTEVDAGPIPGTAEALAAADTATEAASTATDKATVATNAATDATTAKTDAEAAQTDAQTAKADAEAARADLLAQKGSASGIAPLDSGSRVPQANLPTHLDPIALTASIDGRATAFIRPFEQVPNTLYGHSWGSSGVNLVTGLGSTFFERVATRLRTKTITNYAQSGTRMDEILARIIATWTVNTRGFVGFADGIANDVAQNLSSDDTAGRLQVTEAFRTAMHFLHARAWLGIASTALFFGPGWTSGATSTVGSYVDVAVTGDEVDLLFSAVTGSGGSFTVKNAAGTTLATVTTGGYLRAFTLSKKISGLGSGDHTLRVQLASGSGTFLGGLIPSSTPPLIVWAKCGPRNYGTSDDTRMAAYQADAQAMLVAQFPDVVIVTVDGNYDKTTMLDQNHPNDLGNAYYADLIIKSLRSIDEEYQGLNALTASGSAAAYTAGTPSYVGTGATVPNTPGSFAASGGTAQVSFTWTQPSDGGATLTSYKIRYRLNGTSDPWTEVTGISPSALAAVISSGLTTGSAYEFQIAAGNSVGFSAWSASSVATAAAPVVTWVADTFTRSDTSGGPGTTETGGLTWAVKGTGNVAEVVSNELKFTTIGTAPQDVTVNSGHTDGTIQGKVKVGGFVGGLSFREDSTSANGYLFYNNASNWSLRKRTAGSISVLATGSAVAASANDVMTVILNGSSIICKVNGTTQVTTTDASYNSQTYEGFYATTANHRFDDFSHTSATS